MARNRGYSCRMRGSGLFGSDGVQIYWGLRQGQPLVLEREPGNPVDKNAIVVADLMGRAFCYVEHLVAAQLAPMMDAGRVPMAKVLSPASFMDEKVVHARATVWFDGTEELTTVDEIEKELSYE